MFLHDKEVSGATFSYLHEKLGEIADNNKTIIEATAHIESMIKHGVTDISTMQQYYDEITFANCEIAFMLGLQEGCKMLHGLLADNGAKEYMRTWNIFTERDKKSTTERNIDSIYYNIKHGFKDGYKIAEET
jgi:hypothetical protein